MPLPLHAGAEGLSLVEVALITAMAAGAVTGGAAGWFCKRSVGLSLIAFMIGIIGGLLIGTWMGRWLFTTTDGSVCYVGAGMDCLGSVLLAALAGSVPTALLISAVISFLTLRHMHPRPPRCRTGLLSMACGVIGGLIVALFVMVV
jgi:hypothetical protein